MAESDPDVPSDRRHRAGSDAATEHVRRRYERTAADYERIVSTAERTFFRGCRSWACEHAAGDVLDLAAGTGRDLPLLAAHPAVTSVTAVDLSPAMLDLARRRPVPAEFPIHVEVADAADLPCADGTVDTVVAALAMDVVPDPAAVLREVVRVLRPGGQLVAFHFVTHPWAAVRVIQRALGPLVWRFQGIDLTRDPRRLVTEAGLTMVESRSQAGGLVLRYRATRT